MSDLFHEKSTFEFTGKCFATMIQADQLNDPRDGRIF